MNDIKRIYELEFDLLQAKYVYYIKPDLHGISDYTYDELEKEYLDLCDKYRLHAWVYYMVGYTTENPLHEMIIKSIDLYGGVNFEI